MRIERSALLSPDLKASLSKEVESMTDEQLSRLKPVLESEAPITAAMLKDVLRLSIAKNDQEFLKAFDGDLADMNRSLNRESESVESDAEKTKAEHLFDNQP